MSGSASSPRFRIRLEDGSEIAVSSVEALARRVARADILPDTQIFDASIGEWNAAGSAPVVRFILEEFVRETGAPPDGWGEVALGEPGVLPPAGTGSLDFSGFTIVADEEGGTASGVANPSSAGSRPASDPDSGNAKKEGGLGFGFTLESLPEDIEPPRVPVAPAPEVEQGVIPIEVTGDWMQSGLGGGFDENFGRDTTGSTAARTRDTEDLYDQIAELRRKAQKPARQGMRISSLLVVGAVLSAGTWYWFDRVEQGFSYLAVVGHFERPVRPIQTSLPFVEIPAPEPPPPELEADVDRFLVAFSGRIAAELASLRAEVGNPASPPAQWLSGYYMANAGEFEAVVDFWDGYRRMIGALHRRDQVIFVELLDQATGTTSGNSPERAGQLRSYLGNRWRTAEEGREALYAQLATLAEASTELHGFLVENTESIRYTPALGPEVPTDPILEIEADPTIEAELKARLDRILLALDRARGDRIPVMDGIEAPLYRAIDRF